jgi:hypothetical protein
MNNQPSMTPADTPSPIHTPLPLTAWWSGFDYIFGYQIKLVKELWGFPQNSK